MQTETATEIHHQAVELRVRDLLLNALTVSSGAIDAISFLALGKVFSAFMTGNIAFLGLRVAGASHAPGGVAILVSMAAFAVGVLRMRSSGYAIPNCTSPPLSISKACRRRNLTGKVGCLVRSGMASYVRPRNVLPAAFLRTPPHCLKKNATPAALHC
jgi:hypothetical protein